MQRLTRLLTKALGDEHDLRVQLPLTLGRNNETEPDLAVVAAGPRTKGRHPTKAILVIEVADDSLRRDRSVKAALYARHRVPEYWIVNVEAETVEVFTEPQPRGAFAAKAAGASSDMRKGANVLMTHLVSCLVEANGNRPRADAGTLRLPWVG